MPFSVRETYHAIVIDIKGKFLGSVEGDSLKETIDDLAVAGKPKIIVNLEKTDFMDSTAIGVLISSLTTVRKAGGDMVLAGMQTRIRSLFLMTRLLGGVFDDYPDVEAASADLSKEST